MNLFLEHNHFWRWSARIIRQFLRVRPGATVLVVACTGIASIVRLVAFLLPLKVLLLAGSQGVPSYFPFIAPEDKTDWIIGLAIGAFIAYGFALTLESVAARWSRNAGREILQGANQMTLYAMQEDQVQKTFADFTGVIAAVLFVTLGALLLAWINPALLIYLGIALLLQFGLTAWWLRGDVVPSSTIKAWIERRTAQYLLLLSSLTFLGGFLVILTPFALGQGGNMLLALLGLILSRQMLNNMKGMAIHAVALHAARNRIDASVFRGVNLREEKQKASAATLHSFFAKSRRQLRSRNELARMEHLQGELEVLWTDSSVAGVKTLKLVEMGTDGCPVRYFQQQIFLPQKADQLDNEAFLFLHISREQLNAPEVFAQFKEGEFRCQICAHGEGMPVAAEDWPQVRDILLHQIWSYQPEKALVRSYRASRTLLHERLTHTFCKRVEIAADTPEEVELISRWKGDLLGIHEQLRRQPLAVHNPDLNRMNVARAGDDHLVMAWGRWTLAPLGAVIFLAGLSENGGGYLEALQAYRSDLRRRTWESDLQLGALCQELEQQINREEYKAALGTMRAVRACHHRRVQANDIPARVMI